jgi:hypothetical protein
MALAGGNATEIRGVSMLGFGKTDTVRPPVTASSARHRETRNRDICQRYAAGLYRQAFLTLGDSDLAERVACDVIVDECAPAPAPEPGEADTRCRLAESVFRRCQRLTADPARRDRRPAPPPPDDVDPGGLLSEKERGAIGLVLIGGLGYARASSVLGICPHDMAALLRTALLRLGTPE